MFKLYFFITLLYIATSAFAANTIAVLEIIPKSEIDVSITEMRHLTDELRRQAVLALPSDGYAILTRDNMIALMPPDEDEAECLAEGCAVDIGRAIGAEYISSGSIGSFGGELSVSIELYETMSGKLLGSIVMESSDVKGLMIAIREQAPGLFSRIAKDTKTPSVADKKIEQLGTIPTNIETETKSNNSWIAVSLDVLGAVALGFGVYQHIQQDKLYKEYKEMPEGKFDKEYRDALQKSNDAKLFRDIGFITGGVLLASGIAVHIWF